MSAGNEENDLTSLEQLGFLASKIIHDLKNKLVVITGNAQFAELVQRDPARLVAILSTIKRVGEEAGKTLEKTAALRQALPHETRRESIKELASAVDKVVAKYPGWSCRHVEDATSTATIEIRWLAFVVRHLIQKSGSKEGQVETKLFSGPVPMEGIEISSPTPDGPFWLVSISHPVQSKPDEKTEQSPETVLRDTVMQELIRHVGGALWRESTENMEHVFLAVPCHP